MPVIIDPPSGWLYGFPKPIPDEIRESPDDKVWEEWFIEQGYPKKDIDLALKYSRMWGTPNE